MTRGVCPDPIKEAEHQLKKSISQTGHTISEATREKLRAARKRRGPLSPEALKNMSDAQKGKKLSNETKNKMSISHTGLNHSEETIEKIREGMIGKNKKDI